MLTTVTGVVASGARRLRKVAQALIRGLTAVAALVILAQAALITLNVALRAVGFRQVQGAVEMTEVGLVFVVFLALGATQQQGGHVSSDLVTSRLHPSLSRVLQAATLSVMIVLLLYITWHSFGRALDAYQIREARFGVANIPLWPARFVIPLGWFCLSLELIFRVIDLLAGMWTATPGTRGSHLGAAAGDEPLPGAMRGTT